MRSSKSKKSNQNDKNNSTKTNSSWTWFDVGKFTVEVAAVVAMGFFAQNSRGKTDKKVLENTSTGIYVSGSSNTIEDCKEAGHDIGVAVTGDNNTMRRNTTTKM